MANAVKLYDLPRGSFFVIAEPPPGYEDTYQLDHIDGMYSVCYNGLGQLLHFIAWLPVIQVNR